MRTRGVATEPPPVVQFFATVTQWEIYDVYMTDYKKQLQDEEILKNQEKRKGAHGAHADEAATSEKEDDMVHSQKMGNALKILERMVNQNAEDDIFQDFKYWEDASDLYRNSEGSLLPLWRFSPERLDCITIYNLFFSSLKFLSVSINFQDKKKTSNRTVLESGLSRSVCSGLWELRLHETRFRHGLLLYAQKHIPPRIYFYNRIWCDVSGVSSASPVLAGSWMLRWYRCCFRRTKQN